MSQPYKAAKISVSYFSSFIVMPRSHQIEYGFAAWNNDLFF
jgi:hypothetical protein